MDALRQTTYGSTWQVIGRDAVALNVGEVQSRDITVMYVSENGGMLFGNVTCTVEQIEYHVQAPANPQNYNRYAYVLNNPLKYTDPSGEWIHLLIGAVIGGVTGYFIGINEQATGWDLISYVAVGAVAGALSAGVASGVSSALAGGSFGAGFIGSSAAQVATTSFTTGAIIGASAGFTNGLVSGTGNSLIQGNDFSAALNNGMNDAWKQGIGGAVLGGIIGGIDAYFDNRNVWTGTQKAMGRSSFSFHNVDRSPNAFATKSSYRPNNNYNQGILDVTDRKYDYARWGDPNKFGISNRGLSKLENYVMPDETVKINVSSFQGRADLNILDFGSNQSNVIFTIDGNVVTPVNNYIPIYDGAKTLTISVIGNSTTNYLSPLKVIITGYIPKYFYP